MEDNINCSIPWMTEVTPWKNMIRSLEFHFFYARKGKILLPKKQELKYFVDFPPRDIT